MTEKDALGSPKLLIRYLLNASFFIQAIEWTCPFWSGPASESLSPKKQTHQRANSSILNALSNKLPEKAFRHTQDQVLTVPFISHTFTSRLESYDTNKLTARTSLDSLTTQNLEISINPELLFFVKKVINDFLDRFLATRQASALAAEKIPTVRKGSSPNLAHRTAGSAAKMPRKKSKQLADVSPATFMAPEYEVNHEKWVFAPKITLVSPSGQKIESIKAVSILENLGLLQFIDEIPKVLQDSIINELINLAVNFYS